MIRREFIALLASATAAWPKVLTAQSDRTRHLGVMLNLAPDDPETKVRLAAFLRGLQELGWTEGRNLKIDYRWG